MKQSSQRPKITLALAPAVLVLAWGGSAPAQDSGRSRPTLEAPLRDHRAEESRPKSLRIGAIGAGRQHLGASTTVVVPSIGSATEELALDSWFINPRLGFLWISSAGLAFGMDAGAQIPLSSSVSSTLPLSLVPSVQQVADTFGNSAIPTVDLLRLGLLL